MLMTAVGWNSFAKPRVVGVVECVLNINTNNVNCDGSFSQLPLSLQTLYQFMYFWLTYSSCTCRFFLHHSSHPLVPHSFTPSLKPMCFPNPSHHKFTSSSLHGLFPGLFLLKTRFCCLFFIFLSFILPCTRYSWFFLSFWAQINVCCHMV